MKSLKLALLIALLFICQPTWADTWNHTGASWTSSQGCVVDVPAALKVSVDKNGTLTAEGDTTLALLIPMDPAVPADQVMPILEGEAVKQFKGAKFSDPKTASNDGLDVTIKYATITEGSESVIVTLANFMKGAKKIAVMTVQKKDDKTGDALLSQMMGSLNFK